VYNETSNIVEATNNWWGCSGGPGATNCDTIGGAGDYLVNYEDYSPDEFTDCLLDEEPTNPSTPTQPSDTVGGDIFTVNKTALIVPWIALGVIIIAGSLFLYRRRVHGVK